MNDNELKTTLEKAGFSPYQADAYIELIKLGSASAAELAEESGVPGPRIYDIIRDLDAKDYVEMYDQGSLHARIHDPTATSRDLENLAEEFSKASEAIQDRWEQPELGNHSMSIVRRFETVHKQAASEIIDAENQIQLSATVEQFESLASELASAAANDVHIRISIHPETEKNDDIPATQRFEGACTEVRFRELPSPFLAIVDRSQVFFAPHPESADEYGTIVNNPTHSYIFHSYFLTTLWGPWETIYSARDDALPRSYVDILYCVHDVERLLSDEATVRATVVGKYVSSSDPVQLHGEITDTVLKTGPKNEGQPAITQLGGIASIVLETDNGTYTAGGWGAMIEDIEATRIILTDIEYPD